VYGIIYGRERSASFSMYVGRWASVDMIGRGSGSKL
jgi:hypothetical protein